MQIVTFFADLHIITLVFCANSRICTPSVLSFYSFLLILRPSNDRMSTIADQQLQNGNNMETNKNILTKMLRMAAFLMATPLLFTACSDDDDAPVPPTVQAAAVADAATMHSLAFEVSNISGADSVKYVFGKDVAGSTPETVARTAQSSQA